VRKVNSTSTGYQYPKFMNKLPYFPKSLQRNLQMLRFSRQ